VTVPVPAIEIDRFSPVPLYFQISRRLEAAVDDGSLSPGEMLPTEIEFAGSLAVSRPTMRRALDELVEKGILVRKRGVGTRVNSAEVRRRVALTSLHDDLRQAGRSPSTRVLRFESERVDAHAARALGLPPGTPVVFCERLRLTDGTPIAVLHNWLAPRFADITASDLEAHGLYDLLGERNGRPSVANQRISATGANAAEAKLLRTRRGDPLITMRRTAFDSSGRAVEYAENLYRADLYAIEVTVFDR
jgi:DNA-binding GntR family transcriptional regulator